MKIRTAIVGCGALASGTHLPNSQKSELLDLIEVCDISEGKQMQLLIRVNDDIRTWKPWVFAYEEDKELPCPFVFPEKGHFRQLEEFGRAIQGEDINPCPLESAIAVTNVNLCLLQSARTGVPVKVMPQDWNLVGIKADH